MDIMKVVDTEQPIIETTASPEVKTETQEAPKVETNTTDDIISKINKAKIDEVKILEASKNESFEGFNYDDIEKIENPQAREYAIKAYKSFERGYNKKFQEVANLRKTLEQKMQEESPSTWTIEKVNKALQDPAFIQAAQQYVNMSTNDTNQEDTWSTLTDQEKEILNGVNQRVAFLEHQNQQLVQKQQQEMLKTKYADFDEKKLNTFVNSVTNGQYIPSMEDAWKILSFTNMQEKAYKMGLKDGQSGLQEKVVSTTTEGIPNVIPTQEIPVKQEGQTNKQHFLALAFQNMKKMREKTLNLPIT